jgi:hypothetical protein
MTGMWHDLPTSLEGHKNIYVQDFEDGSTCAVSGEPRRVKLLYYCDEFASHTPQATEGDILDINKQNL